MSRRRALLPTLLACAALGACGDAVERPPNVLVIVVDTLRADRVGPRADGSTLTPRLDARPWVAFSHAQSPRAKTNPAMASLWTGLAPREHGVRDLATRLAPDVPVLAERFRDAGWDTVGIVGNYVLKDSWSGFARGFDHWIEDLPQSEGVPPHHVPSRTARSLTDGALCALGLGPAAPGARPRRTLLDGERPFFLYLHYMDPHGSYTPPAEHRAEPAQPELVPGVTPLPYNVGPECERADGAFDAACVRAAYDGEVRYVDAEVGRLLAALETAGLLSDTWVVVTSDHGESLGEHDYWFEHGRYAYEATCRVPLLVAAPRGLAGARRVDDDVALLDLAPTLLELCGLEPLPASAEFRGRSFAPLLRGERLPARVVECEKLAGDELAGTRQILGVRAGDWKLLRSFAWRTALDAPGPRELVLLDEELYDLAADPHEAHDLLADGGAPPAAAPLALLRAELAVRLAAEERGLPRARARADVPAHDPEHERVLRALGY